MPTPTPTPRRARRAHSDERYNRARAAGFGHIVARVLAARALEPTPAAVAPGLSALDHYAGLADIQHAAQRIASAVGNGEVIALETDHDVDGVASHAVLDQALKTLFGHPAERIQHYIGHRLYDGYGLSEGVADRILVADPRPAVVITADNGSSDEPRIARLRDAGIDVIVTDHHEMPETGPPPSAYAVLSPQHPRNAYPDTGIAGCMVAWLLVAAVRARRDDMGATVAGRPRLAELLDYVALGTIADCVTLGASPNNRAVVRAGLARINAGARACWRVLDRGLSARDLAFGLGPKLNARGRLDEAMAGVTFLTAEQDAEAAELYAILERYNEERKRIEHALTDQARAQASEQLALGNRAAVVWLADGHTGVQGIVASRVTEAFGVPSVCLSPKHAAADQAAGSVRGVGGFHARRALQCCEDDQRGLLTTFGGHEGAAGLSLPVNAIPVFREAFLAAASAQLTGMTLGPCLWTDGEISPEAITLELVDELAALEPFGRGMPPPVFEAPFAIARVKRIGDGRHLKFTLRSAQACTRTLPAVWFNAVDDPSAVDPVSVGQSVHVAFSVEANEYAGERRLQLRIHQARLAHHNAPP